MKHLRKFTLPFHINEGSLAIIFIVLFGSLTFFMGLGFNSIFYIELSLVLGIIFLTPIYFLRRINYPEGFTEYKIFILIGIVSLAWSIDPKRSTYYIILFLAGGVFWLLFFNLKKEVGFYLGKLIILVGIMFATSYFYDFITGVIKYNSLSLYLPVGLGRNHNHIGDFWILPSLIILDKLTSKSKVLWYLFLIPATLYILTISYSRSAYLALVTAGLYLLNAKTEFPKKKLFTFVIVAASLLLFLYSGLRKSVLFSRPYLEQVVQEISDNSYGVGLGNFGIISLRSVSSPDLYSAYTHNIFLEMIIGLGVYGFVFVYWFWKVAKNIFWGKGKSDYLFKALWLALTVNFIFDYTYFIPTMLFLWFALLGLAQKSITANKKQGE